jgi:hypothetical protein
MFRFFQRLKIVTGSPYIAQTDNHSSQPTAKESQSAGSTNPEMDYYGVSLFMALQQSQPLEQSQRIQIEMERHQHGKLVKIRVEHHDERLGWYTSGSLSLPLHQLPLLEQAVADMRAYEHSEKALSDKIIQFPGLMIQAGETSAEN